MILLSTAFSFQTLIANVEALLSGVLALDPQQAALRGGLTLLVVLGATLLIWGLRITMKALTERLAPTEPGAPPRKRVSIGRWTLRVARIAILITALLIVLRLWGLDFSAVRDGPLGMIFAAAGRVAVILVIALGAIELSQLAIAQVFARIATRARNPRRAAQIRTLSPLLIGVVTTTLFVIAAMMTLSEFGVEIGPLIAGAGIVGLAVGFGAQTLVKDFLTGIFLILEDIVSVGDSIKIDEFSGVVEEMSLRTIKLRDFNGTLHVFPYSEAQVIHNTTKSFSFAVFELTVVQDADLTKAIALMHEVADDLKTQPDLAHVILAPAEILGVDKIIDGNVLLKGRIKTQPGQQGPVQRAFLMSIVQKFNQVGIDMASRSMTLVAATPPPADQ